MAVTSWRGQLPEKAIEVVELQDSFFDIRRRRTETKDQFKEITKRLTNLKGILEKEEEGFFQKMNIPSGQAGLRELQDRLDRLNQDIGFRSMANVSDSLIGELLENISSGLDLTQEFILTINEEGIQDTEIEKRMIEDAKAFLIETLNQSSEKKIINSKTRGLGSYIAEVKLESTLPLQVKITPKDKFPKRWVKKLEKEAKAKVQKNSTQVDFISAIKDWLDDNIKDPEIRSYVDYQFDYNINKYSVNTSMSSLKGFLGEVRAAAFFDYLSGRKGAAEPTGALRSEILKDVEIPIDLVLENAGFQVKNIKVTRAGKASLYHRDKMGMGNFIEQRLRPESLSEIMIAFFGSYQFNQPVEDATKAYQAVYKRFSKQDRIKEIFDLYVDNILKISEEFSVENSEIFGAQQVYFNSFFIVENRIVPSSAIIKAIIKQLEKANEQTLLTSSYYINGAQTSDDVWSHKKTTPSASVMELANKIQINWNVKLDLEQIINSAYETL